jgi:hypothetical protein
VNDQGSAASLRDHAQRLPDLGDAVTGDLGITVGEEPHRIDDVAQLGLVIRPVLDAEVVVGQPGSVWHPATRVDLPRMPQVDDRVHAECGELSEIGPG